MIKLTTTDLSNVGPSPCEKHHCRHQEQCKAERLACAAFHFYVQRGYAPHPDSKPKRYGKSKVLYIDSDAYTGPSRALYEKIFSGSDEAIEVIS